MKLNDTSDPQELKDQVKRVFDEWIRISDELPADDTHDSFVASLQHFGFLKVELAHTPSWAAAASCSPACVSMAEGVHSPGESTYSTVSKQSA